MVTIILGSSEYAEEVYKSHYKLRGPCYHTPECGMTEVEQVEYIKEIVQYDNHGSMVVYTHSAVVLAQFQLFVLVGLIPEIKILFVDAEGVHEVPIDVRGRIKTSHPIPGKVYNQLCEELIGF